MKPLVPAPGPSATNGCLPHLFQVLPAQDVNIPGILGQQYMYWAITMCDKCPVAATEEKYKETEGIVLDLKELTIQMSEPNMDKSKK